MVTKRVSPHQVHRAQTHCAGGPSMPMVRPPSGACPLLLRPSFFDWREQPGGSPTTELPRFPEERLVLAGRPPDVPIARHLEAVAWVGASDLTLGDVRQEAAR